MTTHHAMVTTQEKRYYVLAQQLDSQGPMGICNFEVNFADDDIRGRTVISKQAKNYQWQNIYHSGNQLFLSSHSVYLHIKRIYASLTLCTRHTSKMIQTAMQKIHVHCISNGTFLEKYHPSFTDYEPVLAFCNKQQNQPIQGEIICSRSAKSHR